MSERLARWLPSLLLPVEEEHDGEEAFSSFAAAFTAQIGVFAAGAMVVFTVLWWAADAALLPDERHVAAFSTLRWRALAVEAASVALLTGSSWARRRALVVGPLLYALFMAGIGSSLGRLGGGDLTLLADAYLGIFPLALVPLRLGARLGWTAAVAAALIGGFAASYPGRAAPPMGAVQLSYLVFAIALSVTIGEMLLRMTRQAFFKARTLETTNAALQHMTRTLSETVAERTRELRSLALHLSSVQEAERRRIARDLHDDLGQSLTAMRYTLARAEAHVAQRAPAASDLLSDLSALIDGTSATIRGFVSHLRPRVLDDLGLVAAAEWLCERIRTSAGVACVLRASSAIRDLDAGLDPDLALALFRVIQEATTNALKHADAGRIDVQIDLDEERVRVCVRDDGAGFEPSMVSGGFGLLGLKERVRPFGGELEVRSAPGQGTEVSTSLRFVRREAEDDG